MFYDTYFHMNVIARTQSHENKIMDHSLILVTHKVYKNQVLCYCKDELSQALQHLMDQAWGYQTLYKEKSGAFDGYNQYTNL